MQTDFDLVDAVSLDLLHSEPHTVSRYRIPLFQEVALQFEHQTGQCFGTPLDIGESTFAISTMRSKSPIWVLPSNR